MFRVGGARYRGKPNLRTTYVFVRYIRVYVCVCAGSFIFSSINASAISEHYIGASRWRSGWIECERLNRVAESD